MGAREELLRREEAGWHELNELLSDLSEGELGAPGLTAEGWSAKDLMWHIARWAAECARVLDRLGAGTSSGAATEDDAETLNRRWFEESRGLDAATVKTEWFAARTIMVERFASSEAPTPEAQEWFEGSGPLHYEEHVPELRAWIAELRRRP